MTAPAAADRPAASYAATPTIGLRTRGVHHLALRVTDLARAKVFYVDRLGFPLLMETPELFLFAAGGTAFGVRGPAAETDPADAFTPFRVGLDHVALACDDEAELRRVAAALAAAGVENTGVKLDETLQKNYVAFRDPDGIKWEFYMAEDAAAARRAQLRAAAEAYFAGLAAGDLSRVPYAPDVRLHAPLAPGGASVPQVGPAALAFLEGVLPLIGEVRVLDYYVNDELTGITATALVGITSPAVTLRVADRFTIDAAGRIVEQENHYDPRVVTDAGSAR
jgi:catechol 2,3-dioxygenase-like lactoylglutathione lyase family enzyme